MAGLDQFGPCTLRVKCIQCSKEVVTKSIPSNIPQPVTMYQCIAEELGLTSRSAGNSACRCLQAKKRDSGIDSEYDLGDLLDIRIYTPLVTCSAQPEDSLESILSSPMRLQPVNLKDSLPTTPLPPLRQASSTSSSLSTAPQTPVAAPRTARPPPPLSPKSDCRQHVFLFKHATLPEICTALRRYPALDTYALVSTNRTADRPPYLVISSMAYSDRMRNPSAEFPVIGKTVGGWINLSYFNGGYPITEAEFRSVSDLLRHYRDHPTRYGGFLNRQLGRSQVHRE